MITIMIICIRDMIIQLQCGVLAVRTVRNLCRNRLVLGSQVHDVLVFVLLATHTYIHTNI